MEEEEGRGDTGGRGRRNKKEEEIVEKEEDVGGRERGMSDCSVE